ncbi:Hok/Gef family protein [Citrobacter sp. FP75]|uniref:Hok/Gef family protein n=1 Tax=Citrobacter sp. FP75 TaxID=1852949 RepID=UPI001BCA58E4
MPGKTLLFGLIVICVTVRRSLCELEIKAGDVQVVAQVAYEANLGIEIKFQSVSK